MKISEPMLLKNRGNIGILFFFGVIIMPFAIAFLYALLYSFGLVGILNDGFTIAYWLTVLSAPQLGYSFLYSGLIAAVSVIFSVGLSLFTVLYLKNAKQALYQFYALHAFGDSGYCIRILYISVICSNRFVFKTRLSTWYHY